MEASEKLRQQTEDMTHGDSSLTTGNRKQPLFKASIGGIRPMGSQAQSVTLSQDNAEDLDGQSTPAGPMPKSKGGPVPLMSLEIRPPSPAAAMPNSEESSPIDQNKP